MVCAINLFVKLAGLGIEKIVHRWFVIWWFVKKMVCDRARVPVQSPSQESKSSSSLSPSQESKSKSKSMSKSKSKFKV